MQFEYSTRTQEFIERLEAFMDQHVYPNEAVCRQQLEDASSRWQTPPVIDELRAKARAEGLWNLFLPDADYGAGLTNLEYAPLAEIMGRSLFLAPYVFNCNAPDTGNMEVLAQYGTEEQKQRWLVPLLNAEINSAFAMTEPDVASSDARNIECSIQRDGDEYVIDGHKWWTSNAMNEQCELFILMGKTDPTAGTYKQQSMILVEHDRAGVSIKRHLPVFGFDDAPEGHAEVIFENVRVPVSNMLLGEGRGFEIAQGRLGPGRIHHCMRTIGAAERALELMCGRLLSRVAFGKPIAEQSLWHERIADARIDIEMCRLLTLKAAYMMDTVGNKAARTEIAMIKVVAPTKALAIIDDAIQAYGGGGVSHPFLSHAWAAVRTLRLADGPDEVHRQQIAKLELGKHADTSGKS
ncbi:MAG: acyl-CoA dehydrogenase family protein [Gammaproteobacteria bacterium]|nr:acyl-CoA dehydrogenase family protein [Gammaproteobacteria bacterium]